MYSHRGHTDIAYLSEMDRYSLFMSKMSPSAIHITTHVVLAYCRIGNFRMQEIFVIFVNFREKYPSLVVGWQATQKCDVKKFMHVNCQYAKFVKISCCESFLFYSSQTQVSVQNSGSMVLHLVNSCENLSPFLGYF